MQYILTDYLHIMAGLIVLLDATQCIPDYTEYTAQGKEWKLCMCTYMHDHLCLWELD